MKQVGILIEYLEHEESAGWFWRTPHTLWSGPFQSQQEALLECLLFLIDAARLGTDVQQIRYLIKRLQNTEDAQLRNETIKIIEQMTVELIGLPPYWQQSTES